MPRSLKSLGIKQQSRLTKITKANKRPNKRPAMYFGVSNLNLINFRLDQTVPHLCECPGLATAQRLCLENLPTHDGRGKYD